MTIKMRLTEPEKKYLIRLFGSRIYNQKYRVGKLVNNGEILYYCVNKEAIKKWGKNDSKRIFKSS